MNYLAFILQWYNWPYLAGFLLGVASLFRLPALDQAGRAVGRWLGIRRVSGRMILRVLGLSFAVVGFTVSGAVHDYWPAEQVRGFLPGLIITALVAALITRSVGRLFERHFPEIKAVGWGSPDLSGHEGRVVSREVSPDYRAGRAQVMGEDDTLHTVMCKTREGEIWYGATVVLGEYDAEDGRYFVEEVGTREETPG
jgi:hypothetical protein